MTEKKEEEKIPEPGSPEDYMDLTVPDFSEILGCTSLDNNDKSTHLGILFDRITACGKSMGDTFIGHTCRITCPECIAEVRFRQKNLEAAKNKFGVVTHKGAG